MRIERFGSDSYHTPNNGGKKSVQRTKSFFGLQLRDETRIPSKFKQAQNDNNDDGQQDDYDDNGSVHDEQQDDAVVVERDGKPPTVSKSFSLPFFDRSSSSSSFLSAMSPRGRGRGRTTNTTNATMMTSMKMTTMTTPILTVPEPDD